jgi:hypothetical protein
LTGVKYDEGKPWMPLPFKWLNWIFPKLVLARDYEDHYEGIRIETAYGNDLFKRFAKDRSYIESFKKVHPKAAKAWRYFTDYGQSIGLVSCWGLLFALCFACSFYLTELVPDFVITYFSNTDFGAGPVLSFKGGGLNSPFTYIYFSVVTFTTLGFGDITPTWWFPRLLVILEVILGYCTLGLLISILANKVARRA